MEINKQRVRKTETVTLTLFEWAMLLKELEFKIGFVNQDTSIALVLYEKIASQIYGQPVTVVTTSENKRIIKS